MRPQRVATVMLALALAWTAAVAAQQTADELYQAGLYQEEVQGDLQRAIGLYQRILTEHARSRGVAAKAQLHIGLCYETLGLNEAQRAYQRVIDNYGDQSDVVGQARARLAALRPAPVEGRGPVARRLLSGDDTDINNLVMMMPSPDGRRVVYVDLYVGAMHLRDLASGAEEQLLPGLPVAWNWSPVWSPDGTRIAFMKAPGLVTDAHVESIKILDLASRTVTEVPGTEVSNPGMALIGMQPLAWSRDGRFLLYRDNPNGLGEIGIVPVAGGTRRALADSVKGGSLSPDGRWVAYTVGPALSEQVFVQPVSGGARRQITDAPGGNTDPLWSPDGAAIAYQRTDGIWVVPIASGAVAGAPRLAYAITGSRLPLAWTEAGGLYFAQTNDARIPLQLAVDAATGAPAGAAEELAHHPELAYSFAWSPDRQRIAFVVAAQAWESGGPAIAVYAADGSSTTSHRVAEPDERIPQVWWSEDGREVLYRSFRREGGSTVAALDPSTGRVRELFPRSRLRTAHHMSADGRHTLVWDRGGVPDSSRVGWVVAERDGADGHLVVPMKDADGVGVGQVAQISPRGDQLLFTRQKDLTATVTGQAGPDAGTLWVVATDGAGARRVGAALMIRSAVWDPSGRFIAYTAAVDNATTVLRIVEVATGATRDVPLPVGNGQEATVTDWSQDGQFVGIVNPASRFEYWAIEGLLDALR